MRRNTILAVAGAAAVATASDTPTLTNNLLVPACPRKGTTTYTGRVPDQTKDFALTQVDMCYTDTAIAITFTAYNETNFYFDPDHGTNDDIWEYEVMEAFIHHGTEDPQTYLEFEVNPNNVTYQSFIYNPTEVRAEGAPFDHFFVSDPAGDGFTAKTTLDKEAETWVSDVEIPLALFNVKNGKAQGTKWRMQFLRTITSPDTFPDQELGAWNPPDEANFHITKFMGRVLFI
jgi:hypothetical protein